VRSFVTIEAWICTHAQATGGGHTRDNSDMLGGGKLPPPYDLRVRSGMPRGRRRVADGIRANLDNCGGANLAPPCDLGFYLNDTRGTARSGPEEQNG
jgi:hypothetical protein